MSATTTALLSRSLNKYIWISVGFFDHPKVIKLIRRVGLEGAVCLQRLWCFAAQYKPDGNLVHMSHRAIELSAKWTGDPGKLVSELLNLGFLDESDGGLCLHDWLEHQPDVLRTEPPLPYDWNRRRYEVFIRDGFTCRYCGHKVSMPHADHIIPRSRGGSDHVDNLATSCPDCNRRKGARTPDEWLQ